MVNESEGGISLRLRSRLSRAESVPRKRKEEKACVDGLRWVVLMIDSTFLVNLVVASSAIVALLLNAYVAWANTRDKKVELLGSIRGFVAELSMRSLYFDVITQPTKPQILDFQKTSEDMANRIAKRVGRAGAFIGSSYEPVRKLAANLYELSQLPVRDPPDTGDREKFNTLLNNARAQGHEVQRKMGEDIEKRFRLHHVITDVIKRILDP